jgi:hypothetical protein
LEVPPVVGEENPVVSSRKGQNLGIRYGAVGNSRPQRSDQIMTQSPQLHCDFAGMFSFE